LTLAGVFKSITETKLKICFLWLSSILSLSRRLGGQ
jgi:hypothetical protein